MLIDTDFTADDMATWISNALVVANRHMIDADHTDGNLLVREFSTTCETRG